MDFPTFCLVRKKEIASITCKSMNLTVLDKQTTKGVKTIKRENQLVGD